MFIGCMLVMLPILFIISGLVQGSWLNALVFTVSAALGIT
jgi:Mg2+-importing ATPase